MEMTFSVNGNVIQNSIIQSIQYANRSGFVILNTCSAFETDGEHSFDTLNIFCKCILHKWVTTQKCYFII